MQSTLKLKRRAVLSILLLVAGLVSATFVYRTSATNTTQNRRQSRRVPLTVLESSDIPIIRGAPRKTSLVSSKDGQTIYSLDGMTGELFVYDRKSKGLKKTSDYFPNVEAFALGPQGDLYLAQSDSTVQIVNSQGRRLNRFPTIYPRSIAVLNNGNVVIASPSNGKLLHLYSGQGVLLRSFGEPGTFVSDPAENEFLNLGKVIAGSGDQIYYVSTYAVEPYVLRYSSEGQLLGEFKIQGDAVDFQTDLTRDFLKRRRLDETGGVTIITSATVSPYTGHLWLSMNGLSTTGTVYEYDQTGTKLREYAFLLKSDNQRRNITHVKDLALSSDSLDILTWGGTYSLKFTEMVLADGYAVARKNSSSQKSTWRAWANPFSRIMQFWAAPPAPAIPQAPCGQAQPTGCVANCPTGSSPGTVDCGAEANSLLDDRVPTAVACNLKTIDPTPGSTNPGGCTETVEWCNTSTGATGTFTVNKNCNAVPVPTPTPTPLPEPTVEPTPTPEPECAQLGFECGSAGCCNPNENWCNGNTGLCQDCPGQLVDGLCTETPIVIDVLGNGFNLTNLAGGVSFDLNADGAAEPLAWTSAGSDDAWLVFDRNGNGTIDDGTELFGEFMPQPEPPAGERKNGFLALAEYDKPANGGNNDEVISSADAIFSSLRLWQDANHNGISEASELKTFRELGIMTIETNYKLSKKTDEHGNRFRYRAKVTDEGHQVGRWAWDVLLVLQ